MGLIDRILGTPRAEARGISDVPAKVKAAGAVSTPGASSIRGVTQGIKAFSENPWLFASVDLVARTCALIPWKAYRKDSGGPISPRERVLWAPVIRSMDAAKIQKLNLVEMEHPALVLLNKPNPVMDSYTFFYVLWTLKELSGASYIYKSRDGRGKVNGLYPIPRTWISHIPTMDQPYYLLTESAAWLGLGARGSVPERDMILFKTTDPAEPYGEGVGLAKIVGAEIDIDEYASTYLGAYFRNSARPSLLIGIEGADQEEVDRAKAIWNDANRGPSNAHKVHFHSGGIDVHQLSGSIKDTELIEVRKFERNTLLQVSSIPPECLGIIENSNRSTIDAADYHLRKNVISTRMAALWSVFQDQLMSEWDSLGGLIIPQSTIPEDLTQKHLVMSTAPQAFTVNEWRAASGHPPIPGGDVPYVESTYMNGADTNGSKNGNPGDKAGAGGKAGGAAAGKNGA